MSVEIHELTSFKELCGEELRLIRAAVESHGLVTLIVKSHELEDDRKLMMARSFPLGVQVATWEHWIEGAWELFGDGTRLVSKDQRHVILRPLLADLTDLDPSSSYVDTLCDFVQDVLSVETGENDSDSLQGRLLQVAADYCDELEDYGLTEPVDALSVVAPQFSGQVFIFEDPALAHAYQRARVENLAACADVHVLQIAPAAAEVPGEEELASLHNMVFGGAGGLESAGAFVAAEAHGTHAEASLAVDIIKRQHELGVAYNDVALLLPNPAEAVFSLGDALSREEIPFVCKFSLAVKETAFGSAFLQAHHLRGEDSSYIDANAFVFSPYSGLKPEDARTLSSHWRDVARSTHKLRIKDMTGGIKGRGNAKMWDAKLERLRKVFYAESAIDCVKALFENARACQPDLDRLEDDRAAAQAIMDHCAMCAQLGIEPNLRDIEALPVSLVRIAGEPGEGVEISVPGLVSRKSCIILGRLEQPQYSMAAAPQPFDEVLEGLGAPVESRAAENNRAMLLDSIERAEKTFVAYRRCHDVDGEALCQSALWDELMSVYRTEADDDKPINAIPAALKEHSIVLSEADAFVASSQAGCESFAVNRGLLQRPDAVALLEPDTARGEAFSPTALEDYYRCPYRWFITRRIGANQIDKLFDQIAQGNLAHATFDRIFANMVEAQIDRVTPDNVEECLTLASDSFDWQRDHEIERHRLHLMNSLDERRCEEVRGQVVDLVRRDAEFLPGFKPAYAELVLERPDGSPMEYAGVPVRGKVDRIDMDDAGNAVVIDYKLSGLKVGYGFDIEDGKPTRIQTDIYATLVERYFEERGQQVNVIGSVYRSYKENNLRGVYSTAVTWGSSENNSYGKDALPNDEYQGEYSQYLQDLETEVASRLERLVEGRIEADPICKDACAYCLAGLYCKKRRS